MMHSSSLLNRYARQLLPIRIYLYLKKCAIKRHEISPASSYIQSNALDKIVKLLVIKLYKTGKLQNVYALERLVRRFLPARLYLKIRQRAMIHLNAYRKPEQVALQILDVAVSPPIPLKKTNSSVYVMKKINESMIISPPKYISQESNKRRLQYDIVICVAFLQRHDLLRLVIENLQDSTLSLAWVLVGSSKEDIEFLQSLGRMHDNIFGFQHENNPLGRKWNFAVNAAEKLCRFDLLAITGSDDILSRELLENVHKQYLRDRQFKQMKLAGTPSLYATQHWFMLDLNHDSPYFGSVFRVSYRDDTVWMPVGAGRFYTGDFIQEFSAYIFDESKERLLDDDGFYKIVEQGESIAFVENTNYTFMSVKCGEDELNAFEVILTADTICAVDCSLNKSKILENFSAIQPLKSITSNNKLKALIG